jgi:two-component system, NtrC family, response regulator AtoC
MAAPHILVVGNEPATVHSINSLLARNSYNTEAVAFGAPGVARIYCNPMPDLVLLELGNGRGEGLETLQQFLQLRPALKVIVLSKVGDSRQVVEAIRIGAHDYITVPFGEFELLQLLKRHVNTDWEADAYAKESVEEVGGDHFFISASPVMQKVRLQAELLANIDVPVLILGESGTGKEVTAHLIHKLSTRSDRRLLKINCAALPGELLESELFGYERGAFTGATRTKAGKFELCDKGTILLDEVADMSANLQAKLLHVLQDQQFFRLGGEATIEVDVRILASTNVDIQQAIAEGRFREDLYYRLSAFTILLPPLRERREEIPVLLHHFMQRTAAQYSRVPLQFSTRLTDACLHYAWPGNIRELQNFVKRYVVMADEGTAIGELQVNQRNKLVTVDTVPERALKPDPPTPASVLTTQERARDLKFLVRNRKDETEIQAITKALAETKWNRTRAARLLHISYRGLLYKIRQHAITRVSSHEPAVYQPDVNTSWIEQPEEAATEEADSCSSAKTQTSSERR